MIRVQITERPGADLFATLRRAMRGGTLRTFSLERRGSRVVHQRYPGWMNWSHTQGAITCEILSPRKREGEWQLLSSFVGRLADKFADRVESIHIQLTPPPGAPSATRKARKTGAAKRR
jgi:hypothetical protein